MVRVFIIKDLDVNSSKSKRTYDASVATGVGIGENHPDNKAMGLNLVAKRKQTVMSGATQAKVTITYGYPEFNTSPNDSEFSATSQLISNATQKGWPINDTPVYGTGKQMILDYLKPVWSGPNGDIFAGKDHKGAQAGEVSVQTPQTVYRYQRVENVLPSSVILNYIGRINGSEWFFNDLYMWLCTNITATNRSDGKWDVTYEFLYNIETWLADIIYIDPDTNMPADLTLSNNAEVDVFNAANAVKQYKVYHEANFNNLNLK